MSEQRQGGLFDDTLPADSRHTDSTDIDHDGHRVGAPRGWYGDRKAWQHFVRLLHAKRNGRQGENEAASALTGAA